MVTGLCSVGGSIFAGFQVPCAFDDVSSFILHDLTFRPLPLPHGLWDELIFQNPHKSVLTAYQRECYFLRIFLLNYYCYLDCASFNARKVGWESLYRTTDRRALKTTDDRNTIFSTNDGFSNVFFSLVYDSDAVTFRYICLLVDIWRLIQYRTKCKEFGMFCTMLSQV